MNTNELMAQVAHVWSAPEPEAMKVQKLGQLIASASANIDPELASAAAQVANTVQNAWAANQTVIDTIPADVQQVLLQHVVLCAVAETKRG